MVRIKYDKFGTKNIICDNWGEFFSEFKNWHTKNKGIVPLEHISNEEKFDLYVGFDGESYGDFWPRNEKGETHIGWPDKYFIDNQEIPAVETVLGAYHKAGSPVNELAVLVLNLQGSKTRYNDWKKQEEKAGKVLREIWTIGAAKSTHGLDLDWPVVSQPNDKKNIKRNICNNLGEYFDKFAEYRNSPQGEEEFKIHPGPYDGLIFKEENDRINNALISHGDNTKSESLELPVDLKSPEWLSQKEKINQTLKEIWKTGEFKNSYGLDLNWPQVANNKRDSSQNEPKKLGGNKKELGKIEIFSIFAIFSAIFALAFWLIKRRKK